MTIEVHDLLTGCLCDPIDQARALLLRERPSGVCPRCWALDALHSMSKLEDRTPEGLFPSIAREAGGDARRGEVVLTVGDAWHYLTAALDELVTESRHTCDA